MEESLLVLDEVFSFLESFIGYLKGLDQALNAFLSECYERIYSADEGVMTVKIGLYMIRGENIMLIGKKSFVKFIYMKIGEIDEEIDVHIDYPSIKAEPLKPIVN